MKLTRKKHLIKKIKSNFECQRCNLCCKVPGFVYLVGKDAKRIAESLNKTLEEFRTEFCEFEEGHLVLKSRADHACIFLDEAKGCTIQKVKPQQCIDFPAVWRDADAYDYCEGIIKLKQTQV